MVQRLGELQVTRGQCFWSCFAEVGIVAGGALNSFWTLHSTWKSRFVSWALALHEWVVQYLGCFLIFSFSLWSTFWPLCQCRTACCWTSAQCGICCVRMPFASDLGLFQRGFIVVGFGGDKNMFFTLIWIWHSLLIWDQTTEIAHGLVIYFIYRETLQLLLQTGWKTKIAFFMPIFLT